MRQAASLLETAIAERRVGLACRTSWSSIDAEIAERGGDGFGQPQIHQIAQRLIRTRGRKNPASGAAGAVDRQPSVDDPIAQRQRRGDERARALSLSLLIGSSQLGENAGLDGLDAPVLSLGDRGSRRRPAARIVDIELKSGRASARHQGAVQAPGRVAVARLWFVLRQQWKSVNEKWVRPRIIKLS